MWLVAPVSTTARLERSNTAASIAMWPCLSAYSNRATVDSVQKTGGHISSSLGTVELTVALHRVFDSPRDKLVWDTGHQAYVHKMLTGRRGRFGTLRQFGGISGFLARSESEHDHFGAGHAGTSISAAHGMALARDLKGDDNHVVAIIGDGALTAGMAFEAMNSIGHMHTRVIVVLNDNGMSIAPNVGAVSRMLESLRTAQPYRGAKHIARQVLEHMPGGELAEEARRRIFTSLKALFIPNILFEQLGFTYFGPVDGHDLFAVEGVLEKARDFREGPVFVHVQTQKGHGYGPAEDDNVKWHGVSASGAAKQVAPQYTAVFADAVREVLSADERAVAITAAMPGGTGLLPLFKEFPDRLFDVGICEQHAVTFAAGLATQGIVPIVAVYSTFLQRGFDQVVHDVAVQDLSVVFAMDRGGIVGDDGRTHQGLYDIAYLRILPGMTLMAPKDEAELRQMVWTAYRHAAAGRGPVGVRFPRGTGVGAALAARIPRFVTVEEHVIAGGFGSAVGELLAERGARVDLEMVGVPDEHVDHGAQKLWRRHFGIDGEGIAAAVRRRWPRLAPVRSDPEETAG